MSSWWAPGSRASAPVTTCRPECPWASYAIFEARDAIGGTWDLFRYPGIRSDSDMHTLGYSFRPWDGEKSIADGDSILQYIKDTAAESGVDTHIRFGHRVTVADWSSADACWHVTAERTDTGETLELTAGFLFSCSGYYRYDHGYLPDFAGMEDFGGLVVHPQAWPEDLDVTAKRVVVIGSGATAVTLVPALARTAAHVTMLQRSPTYIASLPERSPVAALARKVLPAQQAGTVAKWFHALLTQFFYQVSRRYPGAVKRMLRKGLERELPAGYDIDTHFTPRYNPWDQRFCAVPNGDLFASIRAGTSSVVTDHVERFTENGVLLTSGTELEADVIVTATGLELLFLGGIALRIDGETVDPASRLTYKGMMLEGVPNLAIAIGYVNASWTLKCDLTCDYVCRLLNHIHGRGLRVCVPRNLEGAAAEDGPLLGLSSGYITRSAHLLPKQGSRQPWRVHQSYLRDYRALKLGDIEDSVMQFSTAPPPADSGSLRRRREGPPSRSPPDMKVFADRVAAITGAASGIGRALAEDLARRGAHLALADVDDEGLAETVARCEGLGVKVTAQHLDVADRAAVYAWADQVVADHGRVNLIFNNAGVALGATIEAMRYEDFEWLMGINFWGVVYGTKAFLPHLKASGEGHVVNLSSVFGLVSIPSQSAYNAAKFAVRGFTDTLRMELEIEGAPVSVTTVHPGGIKTNIARQRAHGPECRRDDRRCAEAARADFERLFITSPEKAAHQILTAVQHDRRRVLIGPDAKAIDLVARLPAGLYQSALTRGARAGARRHGRSDPAP